MANGELTIAQLQEQLNFKKWDPNEGVATGSDLVCKVQSLPDFCLGASSVEEYANYFTQITKGSGGLNALAKTIYQGHEIPPSVQSFTKISYMPNAQTQQFGVLQWPGLPPEVLEKLAREHPGAQMIISTRVDEVLKYSQLATKPWDPGWQIQCKDPDEVPTASVRREMREAEEFLMNGGVGKDFTDPRQRDSLLRIDFTKFLSEITRNSLTFDGIAIWTEWATDNHLLSFAPLPAQQIRLLARPDKANYNPAHNQGMLDYYGASDENDVIHRRAEKRGNQFSGDDYAVAVDETGNIVDKFNRKQLIWYTRNPRLDVNVADYGYPEMEMALTLVTGFTNAINFNCYSEDTEVLTNHGWKLFKDVDIEIDLFATLNKQTGEMEWQKSVNKIWKEYEGDMYHIHSRSLDMLITPEHKIVLQSKPKADVGGQTWHPIRRGNSGRIPDPELYKTEIVENFYKNLSDYTPTVFQDRLDRDPLSKYSEYWGIPVASNWTGKEIGYKKYVTYNKSDILMSGDDYAAFMGMYLSEGSVGSNICNNKIKYNSVTIAQCKKSKGYIPYQELLIRVLGKFPSTGKKAFYIYHSDLANHLSQFGKDCYSKWIPDEIMNATPRQIKIFWDYYLLGDGRQQETNKGIYKTDRHGKLDRKKHDITTTSKKLSDQLQELTMKMGFSSHICTIPEGEAFCPILGKDGNIYGHQNCDTAESYVVCLKGAKTHPFSITKTKYKGFVGCVTVPNHTVYVRREQTKYPCWMGQSDIFDKNAIPKAILALKGNFCYAEDTEVLTKRGWVTFDKADIEIDEFATLNKSNSQFEWQKATEEKVWNPYIGTMYKITGRSLDLLVTPKHNMLLQSKSVLYNGGRVPKPKYRHKQSNLYDIMTAEELYNKLQPRNSSWMRKSKIFNEKTRYSEYWQIPVTAEWDGEEIIENKIFIGNNNKKIIMTGDEYCAFMGMYLSEGCVTYSHNNPKGVAISQNKTSKGWNEYDQLLTILCDNVPYYNGHQFLVYNSHLAKYLTKFGVDSLSKQIPEEIMNTSKRQLQIFLDYFHLGDGYSRKHNGRRQGRLKGVRYQITTASVKLRDQFQEIAIKLGYSAGYSTTKAQKQKRFPSKNIATAVGQDFTYQTDYTNEKYYDTHEFYQINIIGAHAHPFFIEPVQYNGYIGCVTVPNHVILTRRNGATQFSCQTQRQLDALGRVWDNLQRGPRTDWSLPAIQVSEKGAIELISLEPLRKESVYYQYLVNLFMGAICAIFRFPSHRLGYKLSGTERDSRPDMNRQLLDEDDIGLPVLLVHIENLINTYLLGRWPGLKFKFTGKTPKEDARLYEAWLLSMTLDEKRQTTGLPRLIDTVETPAEKEAAQILGLCPVDPSLIGVYQAWIAAKAKGFSMSGDEATGIMGSGGPGANEGLKEQPGSRFRSKKDPAKSLGHGHAAGTRRNSKLERETANSKRPVPPNLREWDSTDYTRVDSTNSSGRRR